MSETRTRHAFWLSVIASLATIVLPAGQPWACGQEGRETEQSPPAPPVKDFRDAKVCPVVRVCRGDTVIINVAGEAKRIGLIGVEAPGLGEPAGLAALRFLENLLAGEAVYVEFADSNPAVDRFGCVPGYLFRAPDGLFVNLELVRQGYAIVPEDSGFEYRPVFDTFQRRAREAAKGRWGQGQNADPQAPPAAAKLGDARDRASPSGNRDAESNRDQHAPATQPAPATPSPATQATAPAEAAGGDTIVHITAKGTKYHRESCSHARKSGRPVMLTEARRLGLQPCSRCKPPN